MLNISTFIEKDSPCLTYERERERERGYKGYFATTICLSLFVFFPNYINLWNVQ